MDGYEGIATSLSRAALPGQTAIAPTSRLKHLVKLGKTAESSEGQSAGTKRFVEIYLSPNYE